MIHYIPYDIDGIGEVFIEIDAEYRDEGIGKYEFWGAYYVDHDWCWHIEEVTWDKELFTEEQNLVIQNMVESLNIERELDKHLK